MPQGNLPFYGSEPGSQFLDWILGRGKTAPQPIAPRPPMGPPQPEPEPIPQGNLPFYGSESGSQFLDWVLGRGRTAPQSSPQQPIALPQPEPEPEPFTSMRTRRPAQDEEDLRVNQRERNDISREPVIPVRDLAAAQAEEQPPQVPSPEQIEGRPLPSLQQPQQELQMPEGQNLDFSRLDDLSGQYEGHLDSLPERGGHGIGRKLLSVLLGYASSLSGGIGQGVQTGQDFYDRPYYEDLQDWNVKSEGLRGSLDTEIDRLGEERQHLDDTQDNELDFVKAMLAQGNADRTFGAGRDDAATSVYESDRDFNAGREDETFNRGLERDKFESLEGYREGSLANSRERNEIFKNRSTGSPPGIPDVIKDEQNVLRQIAIAMPELEEFIGLDQEGNFALLDIEMPSGSWGGMFGASEEEMAQYNEKVAMKEQIQQMVQQILAGSQGDENPMQYLIDNGTLIPMEQ